MNFKNLLTKYKKTLAIAVTTLAVGAGIGFSSTVPTQEYNKLITQKEAVTTQIQSIDALITANSNSLAQIQNEKTSVSRELQILADEKAQQERLEQERIAKEKEEQERIAKEKEEQEKKIVQSNNNGGNGNSNSSNSSSTSNNNSSGSSSSQTPIGKTVWKTDTGKKYHSHNNCGNSQTAVQVSLDKAQSLGLTACKKCY